MLHSAKWGTDTYICDYSVDVDTFVAIKALADDKDSSLCWTVVQECLLQAELSAFRIESRFCAAH
jgi:hypothetical protein